MRRVRSDIVENASAALAARDAHAVRVARLRRDAALTPAERLAKFEALQRDLVALREARRLP